MMLVETILAASPETAKTLAVTNLALHLAISVQAGAHAVAIVTALLAAYPKGAQHANRKGWLPLHIVALCKCNYDDYGRTMVTAVFQAYPAAAQHRDGYGALPLHYAVQEVCDEHGWAIVQELLAVHPDGAKQVDNEGVLPLHFAVKTQRGEYGFMVIKALLAVYPEGAAQGAKDNWLPLHVALSNKSQPDSVADWPIVGVLYAAYLQQVAASEQRAPEGPGEQLWAAHSATDCDMASSAASGSNTNG